MVLSSGCMRFHGGFHGAFMGLRVPSWFRGGAGVFMGSDGALKEAYGLS